MPQPTKTKSQTPNHTGLLPTPSQNHKPFNTIKNNKALTNKELDKRRAEGFVFGIMRNMLFGRKCKKKQLYTLQLLVGTKDNYDLLMDNRESYI